MALRPTSSAFVHQLARPHRLLLSRNQRLRGPHPVRPVICPLSVLTETVERGDVRPLDGRSGEAGCCSQHPAQGGGVLQLTALRQLRWQQGEPECLHENPFTPHPQFASVHRR